MKPSLSDVKYQEMKTTGHTAGLQMDYLSPSALAENSASKLRYLTAVTSPVEDREKVTDRSQSSVTLLH